MSLTPRESLDVSFEFFPPKNEAMKEALWKTILALSPLKPRFVSVTYGANGSTRERTYEIVKRILEETTLKPAVHMTCVCHTHKEIVNLIEGYKAINVKAFVALRGDPPQGHKNFKSCLNSVELVTTLRQKNIFDVSISAYPEKHPESPTVDQEIDFMKAKIAAGATQAITQFFFDNDLFFRYLDLLHSRGVEIPIIPGILPIHNFEQAAHFSKRVGATIPPSMAEVFSKVKDDPESHAELAASFAAEQIDNLFQRGVRKFHFYTMNRANFILNIFRKLGISTSA